MKKIEYQWCVFENSYIVWKERVKTEIIDSWTRHGRPKNLLGFYPTRRLAQLAAEQQLDALQGEFLTKASLSREKLFKFTRRTR